MNTGERQGDVNIVAVNSVDADLEGAAAAVKLRRLGAANLGEAVEEGRI